MALSQTPGSLTSAVSGILPPPPPPPFRLTSSSPHTHHHHHTTTTATPPTPPHHHHTSPRTTTRRTPPSHPPSKPPLILKDFSPEVEYDGSFFHNPTPQAPHPEPSAGKPAHIGDTGLTEDYAAHAAPTCQTTIQLQPRDNRRSGSPPIRTRTSEDESSSDGHLRPRHKEPSPTQGPGGRHDGLKKIHEVWYYDPAVRGPELEQ